VGLAISLGTVCTYRKPETAVDRSIITAMGDLLKLIWYAVAGLFRLRAALQTEVLALRHQLNVLKQSVGRQSGLPSALSIAWCLRGSITWLPRCWRR
jgi:hypothetical protein